MPLDLADCLDRLVPEGSKVQYRHDDEGPDDMPAHTKVPPARSAPCRRCRPPCVAFRLFLAPAGSAADPCARTHTPHAPTRACVHTKPLLPQPARTQTATTAPTACPPAVVPHGHEPDCPHPARPPGAGHLAGSVPERTQARAARPPHGSRSCTATCAAPAAAPVLLPRLASAGSVQLASKSWAPLAGEAAAWQKWDPFGTCPLHMCQPDLHSQRPIVPLSCRNYGGPRRLVITVHGLKRADGRRYSGFR